MSGQAIATKVANALIEDAEAALPDTPAFALTAPVMESVTPVLARFKDAYGGLWVGGRATLTTSELSFHSNAANRVVQTGSLDVVLAVPAIVSVNVRRGFVTRIIVVEAPGYRIQLRCFGAKPFAVQIRAAASSARGD